MKFLRRLKDAMPLFERISLLSQLCRDFLFFTIEKGAWVASEAQPPVFPGVHSLALRASIGNLDPD